MAELDILSYGISMTTLEEVFLKANGDLDEPDSKPDAKDRSSTLNGGSDDEGAGKLRISEELKASDSVTNADQGNGLSSENLVGKGTLGQSIWALIIKRLNIYKRDRCGLCCELIVPVILVLLGLGLLQIPFLKDSPEFTLDTSVYPSPQRMLFNEEIYVASDY